MQVDPVANAGMTLSAIWFIGQFQGVISPQTPMGSRKSISPLASTLRSSSSSSASIKPCRWPMAASAWAARAMVIGAPISILMACAKSSKRLSVAAFNRCRRSSLTSFEVAEKPSNAAFAAATARSTSAALPIATVPICASVAGFITGRVAEDIGSTHRPPI